MKVRRWQVLVLALAVALALVPSSMAVADVQDPYTLATIEPQTIPLWGPTWNKTDVTFIIEPGQGVTAEAVEQARQGTLDWNRAIHARFNPSPFHLVEITSGAADITIRPKKGGGMVQGQALCDSAGGFFTKCKVNVSGKAFGDNNSPETIRSITIQEVGHSLGLLHSDNTADVMYGTVQTPPNTIISNCDIDAWAAVMHWLLADGPDAHSPHVGSVSCGTTSPSPPPPPPPTGTLDVAVSTDKASYVNKEMVHIFVNTVAGAAVHITIVTPSPTSDLAGDFVADGTGLVHTHYTVNAGRDGTGTFHVHATATKDGASGACLEADPCHADFVVG